MSQSVTKKAPSVEEAIEAALAELGLDVENVNVEVLGNEDGLSVVRVTEHLSDTVKIRNFIDSVMSYIGAEGEVKIEEGEDNIVNVNIYGENVSGLIGKRGDTLYAISYLCNIAVNKDKENFKKIIVDCENYRAKKEEKLIEIANSTAARVRKSRRPIQLQPMPAAERRIIHETLQNYSDLETESFGIEPQRCVVVRMKPYTKVI